MYVRRGGGGRMAERGEGESESRDKYDGDGWESGSYRLRSWWSFPFSYPGSEMATAAEEAVKAGMS